MAYGKHFESMYTGSMVGAGLSVFALWGYVIANSRPPGTIELNPTILATIFGCQRTEIEEAIRKLCEPDPHSRSKEMEGRRLIPEGEFLYFIPTWEKYNKLRNDIERRAQNRVAQKRWRERQRTSATVSTSKQSKPMQMEMQDGDGDSQSTERASPSAGTSPNRSRPQKLTAVQKPDDVSEQVWADWLIHRKAKRATVTATVLAGLRREAERASMPLEQVLATCVQNGWQGFKAEWLAGAQNGRRAEPKRHTINMPLGHATCECDDCVRFRNKRSLQAV